MSNTSKTCLNRSLGISLSRPIAIMLAVSLFTFAVPPNAVAQRADANRANRMPPGAAHANIDPRARTSPQQSALHAAGKPSDSRFSDDKGSQSVERASGVERASAGSSSASARKSLAAMDGANCPSCAKPAQTLRRRDRDCTKPKYPRDRFVPASAQAATRCDRRAGP